MTAAREYVEHGLRSDVFVFVSRESLEGLSFSLTLFLIIFFYGYVHACIITLLYCPYILYSTLSNRKRKKKTKPRPNCPSRLARWAVVYSNASQALPRAQTKADTPPLPIFPSNSSSYAISSRIVRRPRQAQHRTRVVSWVAKFHWGGYFFSTTAPAGSQSPCSR